MTKHRNAAMALVTLAFLALTGCMTKEANTQASEGGDSGVGQTPVTVVPNDSSFETDQDTVETPGLPPASPDGSPQSPGTVTNEGAPIGEDFLAFAIPGRIPFDLLPRYNPRTPTFKNANVLRYFFCIGLTPPFNDGIAVLQLLDKYNLLTAFSMKLAGRVLTPRELRQLLRTVANVDDAASRGRAARRLIDGDMSNDHLRALIGVLYETFLRRPARLDEQNNWIARLKNGLKYRDMVAEISTSEERRRQLGGRNLTQQIQNFILAQYRQLLGREASTRQTRRRGERISELDAQFRFVQQRRRQGRTLAQALRDFSDRVLSSDEYYGLVATKTTKQLLEDRATGPIIQAAMDRLKSSQGDLFGVMEWLFGTQQFYDKFRRFFVQNLTRDWCEANAMSWLERWLGGNR